MEHIDAFWTREAELAARRVPAAERGEASGSSAATAEQAGRDGDDATMRDSGEEWRHLPEGTLVEGRALRDYQLEGLQWLRYNFTLGRSVILGDEMGLGKTPQAVAMLQCLHSLHAVHGPYLVVVPLSTLAHW